MFVRSLLQRLIGFALVKANAVVWTLTTGRFCEAFVRRVLKENPKAEMLKALFQRLAEVHSNFGHDAESEGWLRLTVAIDPEDAVSHALLSYLCFRQDKMAEAIAAAERAIAIDPNVWLGHNVKGRACLKTHNWLLAATALRQALWISDEDSEDARVNRLLAFTYERLGQPECAAQHRRRADELQARLSDGDDPCVIQ